MSFEPQVLIDSVSGRVKFIAELPMVWAGGCVPPSIVYVLCLGFSLVGRVNLYTWERGLLYIPTFYFLPGYREFSVLDENMFIWG